jgi:hypothetical protein
VVGEAFLLLRDALYQLALPAEQQRERLAGMLVTDELALDLDHAVSSLGAAMDQAGVRLGPEVVTDSAAIMSLISAAPTDPIWNDESLDTDPRWIQARLASAALFHRIPNHGLP